MGASPVSGTSSGGGNGNPLQYSCLENAMDRGAWLATVCGVTRVGPGLVTNPPASPKCYVNPKLKIYPSLIIVFLKSTVRDSVGV